MTLETLPEYLNVSPGEQGDSLGIDFESYRHLARTALAIIRDDSLTMGLYRLQDGCALDIFGREKCLTIILDSSQEQLCLSVSPIDSAAGAVCLLRADNSAQSWRKLLRIAKKEIGLE